MKSITVRADFAHVLGPVKPMHSVNNGPASSRGMSNDEDFRRAGFPYVRNHDASFCPNYGGEHSVDVHMIFPDFSADENDPASYDFFLTDEYMHRIASVGSRVFYRLGSKIEHTTKKYGIIPPEDPAKWARICEHIIRHLNEGWADGHHMNIEYWEIWNEPDIPPCWTGTPEQYYELYAVTASHLKQCFPHLKIGGPAVTSVNQKVWIENFLTYLTEDGRRVPMDFFSFHRYTTDPTQYGDHARIARQMLDRFGYTETELILNEWNYVNDWNDPRRYFATIPSLKGSAFVACSLIEAQHSPMDHFMYYDARRATNWNGLFHFRFNTPLKPYWSLCAFGTLYTLGTEVQSESSDSRVRILAAQSEAADEAAFLISYYTDHDSIDGAGTESETAELSVCWDGFASEKGVRAEYYFLDADHDLTLTGAETFGGTEAMHVFRLPLYTTILVRLKKQ